MKRVYVWTLPSRLFHWLFVALILGSWIATLEARWLTVHALLGIGAGTLLVFRIGWGIWGPAYSRFGDFHLRFAELKGYFLGRSARSEGYVGHNPAAGLVMIALMGTALLAVLSGMLLYGIQENRGVLAFLHHWGYRDMELFEAIHEWFVNLLWILIALHLAGVLLDRAMRRDERTLRSIIDGYKNKEGGSAVLTFSQTILAVLGIGGTIGVLLYGFSVPNNPLVAGHTPRIDFARENPVFAHECGSCHTLYPPALLPGESWTKLMGGLEEHFGDDASLDPADHRTVLAYLVNHSADTSTQEMSVKMVQTLPNRGIIAITQTPFWKKRHENIPERLFKEDPVKSRANCKACHADAEQGLIEESALQTVPTKAKR